MPGRQSIKIGFTDPRERKRRKRELLLALFCFAVIILLTWVELTYLGVGSHIFLALLNFTFILLLLVLFIVARNGVKLLLERRRKMLGSRLRTKLVLAFVCLSLVPTVLMFLVSIRFVQTSVDYWFQNQVEESMQQSLELGRAFYASAQRRLERRGQNILQAILERRFAWGGRSMDQFLAKKLTEYDLGLIGVITPEGKEQNWHDTEPWEQAWPEVREKIDWASLREQPRWWSTLMPEAGNDLIVGLLPVDEAETGWFVLGESIGQGLLFKLDQVVRGLDEYKKLKSLKYPWKMTLYLTLAIMTLLIILGSIWFGFRLAKEISSPVQALAAGTERIARGDLAVRLEDHSADELGLLIQSFNRMAEDLEQGRNSLKRAYDRLAQQNIELEQRGRYIEAVLNNITAGVVSLDPEGRVSTVNNAAEAMLHIHGPSIVGRRPLDLLEGEYAELLEEVMEQMRQSPASQWQRQLSLTIAGRQAKFLVNVVSLKIEQGREGSLVAVFEDITELEKMQRMAAWREVARRIAHEIKNPLTPIKLSAQRVRRKYGPSIDDETFNQNLELIVNQVEQMQEMVTEFSSYAKLPEVVLRRDDMGAVAREAVALFEHSHRDIRWEAFIPDDLPVLQFDREGMRRVFINLLTNAVEALQDQPEPAVQVAVEHLRSPGVLRIEVRDNGPGFDAEQRSRLFEPYFSRKRGGAGLGLTIVKSIVTAHQGVVRAQSNEPQGTVFVIELPVD
jgi:two-component system nitrogen regulation sensor histidine kinase NtrY